MSQSNVDDLEDASNEMMLVDDEEVRCWLLASSLSLEDHVIMFQSPSLQHAFLDPGHVLPGGGLRADVGV